MEDFGSGLGFETAGKGVFAEERWLRAEVGGDFDLGLGVEIAGEGLPMEERSVGAAGSEESWLLFPLFVFLAFSSR